MKDLIGGADEKSASIDCSNLLLAVNLSKCICFVNSRECGPMTR